MKKLPERTRFMKGIFAWLGYEQTRVGYLRPQRNSGSTKWNFWKLWNFALDGIFSFSTLPLRIWTYLGLAVSGGAALPLVGTDALLAENDRSPQTNRPLVVTSKTNSAVRETVTTTAWEILASGGSAMDAAEKGTNVSELDPRDRTVGYGGDPNEDGFLQLDASVMNGADDNNIGAVAALENIKTPCSVARLVMDRSDHWLLVGAGAGGGAVVYHEYDSDHWPCPDCGGTVSREFNVCPGCGAEVTEIGEREARQID